ncbi:hypothetical protein RXV94_03640 [Yeosuana sp. MJ-SS3]|uniref:Uncharacterized protein n=1 Tax=Gilvirhabdus luticola TaxID=3079858 RepID=A0ABU3U4J6_9FLAO|nr:hypothetical protein [Yeosuana sp. MJ-SS3]MDU8885239.1 hypothetical protein [Yeosuana sp. MJ-SS3]
MELLLTTEDLEPLPEPKVSQENWRPQGLLNSNYKSIADHNLNNTSSHSIFGIRQRVKSFQFKSAPGIEALLKISLFAIVFLVIF